MMTANCRLDTGDKLSLCVTYVMRRATSRVCGLVDSVVLLRRHRPNMTSCEPTGNVRSQNTDFKIILAIWISGAVVKIRSSGKSWYRWRRQVAIYGI